MARLPYACANVRCTAPRLPGRRYCERHALTLPERDTRRRNRRPEPPRRRKVPAYWRTTYGSGRWRAFQRRYLAAHPWCVDCAQRYLLEPARQLHHVGGWSQADLDSFWAPPGGWAALCVPCHRRRHSRAGLG